MPDGDIYLPVQVGPAEENFQGFVRDNTGDNIASKNPNYCELTVQYWAWKIAMLTLRESFITADFFKW